MKEQTANAGSGANILYPAPLRNLFIRLAPAGLMRARWTDKINDQGIRNVRATINMLRLSP